MKISITNKDRGLGKELSSRFDDVVEGFDKNTDVFINNRHDSFNQTKLLMKAFDEWKYTDKTIINIGSRSKYPNISKGFMYSTSKAALNHLSNNLRLNSDKTCRIIDVNCGLLESELPSLTYKEITEIIVWCINQPKHIEIGEISVWEKTPYKIVSELKDEKSLT
jgi:NADP-dependent 3-hydroxy acid dehydrogenase YdfG|tara:strand:+ start:2389 stop:2883 length:495 start_codon:yes stop_codon:yes gene_type:complete